MAESLDDIARSFKSYAENFTRLRDIDEEITDLKGKEGKKKKKIRNLKKQREELRKRQLTITNKIPNGAVLLVKSFNDLDAAAGLREQGVQIHELAITDKDLRILAQELGFRPSATLFTHYGCNADLNVGDLSEEKHELVSLVTKIVADLDLDDDADEILEAVQPPLNKDEADSSKQILQYSEKLGMNINSNIMAAFRNIVRKLDDCQSFEKLEKRIDALEKYVQQLAQCQSSSATCLERVGIELEKSKDKIIEKLKKQMEAMESSHEKLKKSVVLDFSQCSEEMDNEVQDLKSQMAEMNLKIENFHERLETHMILGFENSCNQMLLRLENKLDELKSLLEASQTLEASIIPASTMVIESGDRAR